MEVDLVELAKRWGLAVVATVGLLATGWYAATRFEGWGQPLVEVGEQPDEAAIELARAHLPAASALAERAAAGCPRTEPPPGTIDLEGRPSPAERDPLLGLPAVAGVAIHCWWRYVRMGPDVGSIGGHYPIAGEGSIPEGAPDLATTIEGARPSFDEMPPIVSYTSVQLFRGAPELVVLELVRPVPRGDPGARAHVRVMLRRSAAQ